jgi:hypothetical protein
LLKEPGELTESERTIFNELFKNGSFVRQSSVKRADTFKLGDGKHNDLRMESLMPNKKSRHEPVNQDLLQIMQLMAEQIEEY